MFLIGFCDHVLHLNIKRLCGTCVVNFNTLMPVMLIELKGRRKYYSKRDWQECYILRNMLMIIHCLTPQT